MHTKQLCVLIHIKIKGEVGTVNMLRPSSNFLTQSFECGASICGFVIYVQLVFVMLSCLLLATL